MTTLPERAGRRCHNVLNPLHSAAYFAPDLAKELAPYGIEDPSAVYLAGRAAAMGAVGPGAVTASFYNFNHTLVARFVPEVWDFASPETVLAARLRSVDVTLRRLLGEETVAGSEVREAAELAVEAARGCTRPGRPLYAAHADLPVPDDPHLALWHAATLLREHRGDAHVAVLQHASLDPLEALVSHTASGRGMAPKWVLSTRGYNEQDWAAAQDRLRDRGLLDAGGELTEDGLALRKRLEDDTDELDRGPYELLGADGVARLTDLATGFTKSALENGAFPADLFGKG
ncbi:SCO6745 family protein [Streptomyces phytohabitans]|uniref:SCO6745 family protein n=1 Tax=Streptomyces phytohabitans TaxID=1150371 RepID=UPI00345B7F69